jgi:hypothetical protein
MLSSLILSFAMSIPPAPAVNLDSVSVQEIGTKRDQVRIGTKRDQVRIGTKRDQVRISEAL